LRKGYEQGFHEGYQDSVAGRSFRAVDAFRAASRTLTTFGAPASDRDFDRALRDGYFAGVAYTAAHSAQPIIDFNYVSSFCAKNYGRSAKQNRTASPNSCAAYTAGFEVGYADGRMQHPAETAAISR
jgi:ribosome modulation factor